MKSNNLIKFPLALLRSGQSEISAILAIFCTVVRNVGMGFRTSREEIGFDALLEKSLDIWPGEELPVDNGNYECISVGSYILRLERLPHPSLIDRALDEADKLPDIPFVMVKLDFLLVLMQTHQLLEWLPENHQKRSKHILSWREFRVFCAIVSAKTNRHEFSFLGWETISARASGFTTKAAARKHEDSLPGHSKLLSRSQIGTTVKRLEAMRFFLRFNYSRGGRGGYSAYSIRHSSRELLAESVIAWADYVPKTISENRQADRELCKRLSPRDPH